MTERNRKQVPMDAVYLNIDSTGPHYEHISEFHKSFFKSVYKIAFIQVEDIIFNFEKNNDYGLNRYSGSYYADNKAGVGKGFDRFSNIITFTGRRGSGKTSAMLSFMDALKHYYGYVNNNSSDLFYEFRKVETPLFTCLDCIDGSLLEHGEDIFKVVLAQIYQKFRDLDEEGGISKGEDFTSRKRELFKKLEEVYGTVCDIENMENSHTASSESYMSSLQSLSSSQKVKRDFEELIQNFIFLMKYERHGMVEKSSKHYVVITIDDIDLNISNGFSMLEKIHRYCMVKNVIVLLSVDIEQMLSIVSKSFYKVLPKVNQILLDGQERVHELATDYLSKVMPVNYRIYVKNLSNYYSADKLILKKENFGIKQSLFLKLYRRIGIYFDSQGLKQHFYEPKSMRQLTCFYLLLESMDYVNMRDVYLGKYMDKRKKEEFIQIWEENYWILMEELSNRIVLEKLHINKKVNEFCKTIEKQDIRRAKDEVVNFYYEVRGIFPDADFPEEKNGTVRVENCSYGQLVEVIYELGRIEGGKYKVLVHYLLGYFSYTFTWSYIYEKLKIEDNGIRKVKKGTFKSLIGGNIVDNWSMQLMPNTVKKRNTDIEELGTASGDKSNRILEYFSNFEGVTLSNILLGILKDEEEFKDEEEKYQYAAELIRNIELEFLFFTNIREEGQKGNNNVESDSFIWEFKIQFEQDGSNWISFKPKIQGFLDISIVGDYSVLNFIENSINAVERLNKLEQELIRSLTTKYHLTETTDDQNLIFKKDFKNVLQKYSLKTKYEKWEAEFGKYSMPLPLHWFDFTYNILKRARRAMKEEFTVSSKIEDMFFCVQKLYENIGAQLREQEKFYSSKKKGENSYVYELTKRFEQCPVVEYFLGTKNSKTEGEKKAEEEKRRLFINTVLLKLKMFSIE